MHDEHDEVETYHCNKGMDHYSNRGTAPESTYDTRPLPSADEVTYAFNQNPDGPLVMGGWGKISRWGDEAILPATSSPS